jgi:hypothetical protein
MGSFIRFGVTCFGSKEGSKIKLIVMNAHRAITHRSTVLDHPLFRTIQGITTTQVLAAPAPLRLLMGDQNDGRLKLVPTDAATECAMRQRPNNKPSWTRGGQIARETQKTVIRQPPALVSKKPPHAS